MLKAWPANPGPLHCGRGRPRIALTDRRNAMLKVALWIVVAIFVIGLLVVFGVLDFIF